MKLIRPHRRGWSYRLPQMWIFTPRQPLASVPVRTRRALAGNGREECVKTAPCRDSRGSCDSRDVPARRDRNTAEEDSVLQITPWERFLLRLVANDESTTDIA